MIRVLTKPFSLFYQHLKNKTQEASRQITLFGVVMMINYPLFGVFWKLEMFQFQQEFIFRFVATILCALLAFNRFWPRGLKQFLPLFWFGTLLFCLPFFSTYLTLLNCGSTLWLMNSVSAIFLLLLVTSALDALLLMIVGVGLGVFCFVSDPTHLFRYVPGTISLFSLFVTYGGALIMGVLFARDRELIYAKKLLGLRTMVGGLAQDLQTPLASIYLQTELQEVIVDKLSNDPQLKKDLKENLDKITRGVEMGNNLITMQLQNIQEQKFDVSNFSIHSIKRLLIETLADYPLKDYEKTWIQLDMTVDFAIWIDEIAFKNMIWNLLKSSLEFIEKMGDGKIKIWMEVGFSKENNHNYLHFKDSTEGQYAKTHQPERKDDVANLGTAYCKSLMDAAGGMIYSNKGRVNESAHYILKFPKVE